MTDFDEILLAKLAREMAMNIRPWKAIFADYGIDETQYYEIAKLDFYARCKEQFTLEWNSTASTGDRVKLGSLAYLEQLLPVITRRAMDAKEHLSGATDVAKVLAKNAGIGEGKSEDKISDRFTITINLGADTDGKPVVEKFDKSIAIDANDMSVEATGYEKTADSATSRKSPQTPASGKPQQLSFDLK